MTVHAPERPRRVSMPTRDPVCRCGHGRTVHAQGRAPDCLVCSALPPDRRWLLGRGQVCAGFEE